MAMTKYEIQFQKGLGLPEFLERFGKEEQCEAHLATIKWPHGFKCPKCGETDHSEFRKNNRPYYQCSSCRYQSSLTENTLFHGSHLSLTRWFMAIYFINVKTGLTGTFHSFECSKYSFRYLGAIMFRFNRRFRLNTIFLKLMRHAGESPPITANAIIL